MAREGQGSVSGPWFDTELRAPAVDRDGRPWAGSNDRYGIKFCRIASQAACALLRTPSLFCAFLR